MGSLRPPRPSASPSPLSAPPLPPPPTPLFSVEGSTLIGICGPHSKSEGKTPNHRTGPRERVGQDSRFAISGYLQHPGLVWLRQDPQGLWALLPQPQEGGHSLW